jgi:hypothetical protein
MVVMWGWYGFSPPNFNNHPVILKLTTTRTIPPPKMNLTINHYRAISCKIGFAENLHNLALTHHGEQCSDEAVQEHVSAALIGPPCISSDYLVKEAEEEMHFADALTNFNQPPHQDKPPSREGTLGATNLAS